MYRNAKQVMKCCITGCEYRPHARCSLWFTTSQDMPPNCPFPWALWIWAPTKYKVPWSHLSIYTKQHTDWFSNFCRAHNCDKETDTQTHIETQITLHPQRQATSSTSVMM